MGEIDLAPTSIAKINESDIRSDQQTLLELPLRKGFAKRNPRKVYGITPRGTREWTVKLATVNLQTNVLECNPLNDRDRIWKSIRTSPVWFRGTGMAKTCYFAMYVCVFFITPPHLNIRDQYVAGMVPPIACTLSSTMLCKYSSVYTSLCKILRRHRANILTWRALSLLLCSTLLEMELFRRLIIYCLMPSNFAAFVSSMQIPSTAIQLHVVL